MITSQFHFLATFFYLNEHAIIHLKYNKLCFVSLKRVENVEKFTEWQREEQTAIRNSYFKISVRKTKININYLC